MITNGYSAIPLGEGILAPTWQVGEDIGITDGEIARLSLPIVEATRADAFDTRWRRFCRRVSPGRRREIGCRPTLADYSKRSSAAYDLMRNLKTSSEYSRPILGRSLDAWIMGEMLRARGLGQMNFRIVVLGPGAGNTERELIAQIAPLALRIGMRVEVESVALPHHPIAVENLEAVRFYGGKTVTFREHFADFDVEPIPDNADILYGIMSTIHSTCEEDLTAKIHNALRLPHGKRPGGEAFFMYPFCDYEPGGRLKEQHANLLNLGVDVTIVDCLEKLITLAHIVRRSTTKIDDLRALLVRAMIENIKKRKRRYRITSDSQPVRSHSGQQGFDVEAFNCFLFGARLVLSANGLFPDAISQNTHRLMFECYWPNVLDGIPIYPDAVGAVYGAPQILAEIGAHGDGFLSHLPRQVVAL